MSNSPQTHETVVEEVRLNLLPGSGETQDTNNTCIQVITGQSATSCCDDKNHRKLAICSIICGISCIGIKALINSVKVLYCLSNLPVKMSKPKNCTLKFLLPTLNCSKKEQWRMEPVITSSSRQTIPEKRQPVSITHNNIIFIIIIGAKRSPFWNYFNASEGGKIYSPPVMEL